MSLLTPIHFPVHSLIFGPLVAKYLAEKGFLKLLKKLLAQFSVSWRIPTCVAHDCKIEIFIGYIWMRWVVIRAGVYCLHFWHSLIIYWILVSWTSLMEHLIVLNNCLLTLNYFEIDVLNYWVKIIFGLGKVFGSYSELTFDMFSQLIFVCWICEDKPYISCYI